MANFLGRLAACSGRGLFAGALGTAAMTASSTMEMKLTGRQASTTPALAVCKALGIELADDQQKVRFGNAIHWLYGTGWGSVVGLIDFAGMRGLPAMLLFFATVWGTELVLLPTMGVTKPATEWSPREVVIDALHHLVYAAATSTTSAWLEV